MNIVVTGLGLVSPYGVGRERAWRAAVAGEDGLRPLTRFDAAAYRNTLAGEVPDDPAVDAFIAAGHPRATAYALAAADEALAHAGGTPCPPHEIALALGTNFGPMREAEAAFAHRAAHPDNPAADLSKFWPGAATDALRRHLSDGAPVPPDAAPAAVLSLSCASGAAALAQGLSWLRAGRARAVLAGGFDELSETAFAGLSALRAISRDTVRPFDATRDGAIFAEGAGVLLLERADDAARRGAMPLVELAGAALNNDAFHMTAPDKTGAGIVAAMRAALADAGLSPDDVDHVNLHGTGTPYNDAIETAALREVFGGHVAAMAFTANKSLFGHAMGAAGALEAGLAALSVARGTIPPTIRSRDPDPALDIPLVRGAALARPLRAALSNSYGLGGTNAVVAFRRPA